jgi:hypothetical protein
MSKSQHMVQLVDAAVVVSKNGLFYFLYSLNTVKFLNPKENMIRPYHRVWFEPGLVPTLLRQDGVTAHLVLGVHGEGVCVGDVVNNG